MKRSCFRAISTMFAFFIFVLLFSPPINAATDGKALFEMRCKACHAINGQGSKSIAQGMKIDPALLDLTTNERKKKTDAELTKSIREGRNKKMPAFPKEKINDDELKAIICHIRSLQEPKK